VRHDPAVTLPNPAFEVHRQLQKALKVQKEEGGLIGEVLVRLGYVTEVNIAHCLSLQFGFPYLSLDNYDISKDVLAVIPKTICVHYCLIPIYKINKTLTIVMANPLNTQAIEDLEDAASLEIQTFISTTSDIKKAIENYYGKE